MNIVIFSPNLKATTGSPIRAFNIIRGLSLYGENINVILVSSAFEEELMDNYKCYNVNDFGIKKTLEIAVKENNASHLFCITHGFANIVSGVARISKIPFFVDIHGIRTLEVLEERSNILTKIKNIHECLPWILGVARADKIFCANPMLYVWMKIFFGDRAVNVCGIADVSKFEQNKNENECVNVLYAGNLRYYQGVDLLLDAIDIIGDTKDFKFYVLGDIGMDKSLKNKIISLKDQKNLKVMNSISYDKYPVFLNSMDVIVIPRRRSMTTYMAFPQKLIEAMSAGKCVIATNLAPHKFALEMPSCGILCNPNPHDLADAILKTKDDELRKTLGEAAKNKALRDYDVRVQVLKILHFLSRKY